jgi:hypothetical protein
MNAKTVCNISIGPLAFLHLSKDLNDTVKDLNNVNCPFLTPMIAIVHYSVMLATLEHRIILCDTFTSANA